MIIRLTLAALIVVPAAMAYPWPSVADRWLLGVAVALVVILFAWWRGLFVTTILGRRIALLTRRDRTDGSEPSAEFSSVTLRVEPGTTAELPLVLVTGYLDRYGIDFDKVRVTSRDAGGARTTWVGLTLGAADNIVALSARSAQLPLQDTAELAARRLSDHLREAGWDVTLDDAPDAVVAQQYRQTWRGVDDGNGHVAAYRVHSDEALSDTLSAVWELDAEEIWTAVEFTGSRTAPEVSAACAVRTAQRPGSGSPVPGLTPERGLHGRALAAMRPGSDQRLSADPVPVPAGLLSRLRWPAGAALSRT